MNANMTDLNHHRTGRPLPEKWEGFSEIDHAIHENRLSEYRLRKALADPINRGVTLFVALILLAFAVFAIVNDVIL